MQLAKPPPGDRWPVRRQLGEEGEVPGADAAYHDRDHDPAHHEDADRRRQPGAGRDRAVDQAAAGHRSRRHRRRRTPVAAGAHARLPVMRRARASQSWAITWNTMVMTNRMSASSISELVSSFVEASPKFSASVAETVVPLANSECGMAVEVAADDHRHGHGLAQRPPEAQEHRAGDARQGVAHADLAHHLVGRGAHAVAGLLDDLGHHLAARRERRR